MEIWVRAVYVIAASINALLICLGLQSSIRIIHLHACTHARRQNRCFAEEKRRLADSRRNGNSGKEEREWRTTNRTRGGFLVCVGPRYCPSIDLLYSSADLHTHHTKQCRICKNKTPKPNLDRCHDLFIIISQLSAITELRPHKVKPDLVFISFVFWGFFMPFVCEHKDRLLRDTAVSPVVVHYASGRGCFSRVVTPILMNLMEPVTTAHKRHLFSSRKVI